MASQNGIGNRVTNNDFEVTQLDPAGNAYMSVGNISQVPSSNAVLEAYVQAETSGDPYVNLFIVGGQEWSMGLDNSDSNAFVIAASGSLGTTNIMRSSVSGEINYPLQPSFCATLSAGILNVTGDGTNYTIPFNQTFFDQGGDFNTGTGVFTAPITGRYPLFYNCWVQPFASNQTLLEMYINTSNRAYICVQLNPYIVQSMGIGSSVGDMIAVNADMDAGDTAFCVVGVYGGSKTVDIVGNDSGSPRTNFSGFLQA